MPSFSFTSPVCLYKNQIPPHKRFVSPSSIQKTHNLYKTFVMAVQAQYPSPAFRMKSNVLEEVLQQRDLFGNFHNQGVGQNLFNVAGTVFSEPESELTCNNMSGTRKRSRDHDHAHLAAQMLQHQQQQFRFPNLPKTQFVEKRLNGSDGASTSGRSSGNSPFLLSSSNAHDLSSHLLIQNQEIDALILLQNEKLRSGLEETRKRHCRSILPLLELQVLKSLEEKENELANAMRRNAELEDKVKQMSAENQIWFNVAKNNEAIVTTLKSSLEQILLQNQGQLKEGFGDSDSVVDDAQSCSSSSMAVQELKRRKTCKVCHENEVSVLLLPCRHLCLCKDCESKHDTCPICNSLNKASLQIFMS